MRLFLFSWFESYLWYRYLSISSLKFCVSQLLLVTLDNLVVPRFVSSELL